MRATSNQPPISAVVPSWNGAELLQRHLPALMEELNQFHPSSECIVVDDGSSDHSRDLLRQNFPAVRLIERGCNQGFSSAANAGIRAARHERLLLLNNDVEVLPGFLEHLHLVFEERPNTFAVASLQKQTLTDGTVALDGFNAVRWRAGLLDLNNRTADVMAGQDLSLGYCTAGCSLFSREKLLAVGGFCELFDPFYYEDVELSLQAARRGWRLAFAPKSVVEHRHGSTTRKKPWKMKIVPSRNYFFLHWLVLAGRSAWGPHLLALVLHILKWLLQGRLVLLFGLLQALARIPELAKERRRRGCGAVLAVTDVLLAQES
ncbi:MAG: glycosyltransferase family 2 protein [Chthoniobacterales bacterium]